MNKDKVPNIEEARVSLRTLQNFKVEVVKPFEEDSSIKPKIVWKIDGFIQSALYRICDLAKATLTCYDNNQLIPAAILSRSVMETTSVFYGLLKQIEATVKEKDAASLDAIIMKFTYAVGFVDDVFPKVVNILTHCNRVDRELPGFRKVYDNLCEVTHPNHDGIVGFYRTLHKETRCLEMTESPIAVKCVDMYICAALDISLIIFQMTYDEFWKLRPNLLHLCRESFPE
jgi:hypothetical protein